jgi:Do/DeqQ family serine protease
MNHLKLFFLLFLFAVSGHSLAALPTHDGSGRELPSLAPMLEQVNPAVVNIATYATQKIHNPLLSDPFFRFFFNVPENYQQPRSQRRQQSAGSGVIVDAGKGIVVTNFHVIKGADEVHVSLNDGRDFEAKIVGTDPDLDIAVLKIKAEKLTAVTLSDSRQLKVGDFVVAIGNPFGLGQTVTTGIVSALGRTGLGIEGYENFIQTDASINPGNSGGALVNLHGELVGVNTAIVAPSGGNVGIGFAIPINMVKSAMGQILKYGKVRRGHIGIDTQDITSDLRQAFQLKVGQRGVLVTGVDSESPAEKAGIKTGDIIVAIDGETTLSSGQLRSQIAVKGIGDEIQVDAIRDGRSRSFRLVVAEPAIGDTAISQFLDGARFENHPSGKGVVITGIEPNSRAAHSGLRRGDVILGINRQRVTNLENFRDALSQNDHQLLLNINRNGRVFYLVIR